MPEEHPSVPVGSRGSPLPVGTLLYRRTRYVPASPCWCKSRTASCTSTTQPAVADHQSTEQSDHKPARCNSTVPTPCWGSTCTPIVHHLSQVFGDQPAQVHGVVEHCRRPPSFTDITTAATGPVKPPAATGARRAASLLEVTAVDCQLCV